MSENGFQPSTPGLMDGQGLSIEEGRVEVKRREKEKIIQGYLDVLIPGLCALALSGGISLLDISSKIVAMIQDNTLSSSEKSKQLTVEELQELENALQEANIALTPVSHWFVPESNVKKQDI